MRRGQRAGRAADLLPDDTGRLLVTVQSAAVIEQRHINVVRRAAGRLGHVACDVRTGALLYDCADLGDELRAVPVGTPRKPASGGKAATRDAHHRNVA